ncbi:MAG: rRNA methyltransferase [Phycisphaerae bacterium]|nr:rRNA methyltransferase [Phycisphaerae bacterium]
MPAPQNLIHLTDPDDPRVLAYRNQSDQWLRARHRAWMSDVEPAADATATGIDPAVDPTGDLFMAEGDKVVAQLVASPHRVVSALVSDHRLESAAPALAGIEPATPVYVMPAETVEQLAGFNMHRGVMALGQRVDPGPIEPLLARAACCVILEQLANHDNVGAIFRNVRALCPPREGYELPAVVLLSPRCCDPLYRKALRVSMGNALHVPFATLEPWPEALEAVVSAGFEPIAMHPSEDSEPIESVRSSRPAIIMGAEGPGLSRRALEAISRLGGRSVRIPINDEADSVNVGVAAAVGIHRLCPWLCAESR